jgi:hypothetical protein
MLKEMPKNKGAAGGGDKTASRGTYLELRDNVPTLAEMGRRFNVQKCAKYTTKPLAKFIETEKTRTARTPGGERENGNTK